MESYSVLKRKAVQAVVDGAKFNGGIRIHRRLHGRCSSPVLVVHYARPDGTGELNECIVAPGKPHPLELTYSVPCGKCEECIRKKRKMWAARAIREAESTWLKGGRIWLGTLTCSPDYLYASHCRAITESAVKGVDLDRDEAEEFRALDHVIYRDISKYLKRLRKGQEGSAPARIRYLCVAERGELHGRLHYHILIHENGGDAVRKAALRAANWSGGFAAYKLCETGNLRSVTYVCKYLAKQGLKVRASTKYGCQTEGVHRGSGTTKDSSGSLASTIFHHSNKVASVDHQETEKNPPSASETSA